MHCPSCDRSFSFVESFKILNPLRYKCPSCASLLTTGRFGWFSIGTGILVGLAIAGVAIAMEEFEVWIPADSFTWFAVAMPVGCALFQRYFWRKARLTLRR